MSISISIYIYMYYICTSFRSQMLTYRGTPTTIAGLSNEKQTTMATIRGSDTHSFEVPTRIQSWLHADNSAADSAAVEQIHDQPLHLFCLGNVFFLVSPCMFFFSEGKFNARSRSFEQGTVGNFVEAWIYRNISSGILVLETDLYIRACNCIAAVEVELEFDLNIKAIMVQKLEHMGRLCRSLHYIFFT